MLCFCVITIIYGKSLFVKLTVHRKHTLGLLFAESFGR